MIVIEVGQARCMHGQIGARERCAAEHQSYAVTADIFGNAAPEQGNGRTGTILGEDAGPAKFKDFPAGTARPGEQTANVEFPGGIEAGMGHCNAFAEQPVRADHRILSDGVFIDDQQVIAKVVIGVTIDMIGCAGEGCGAHFFEEYPPPQALDSQQIGLASGQTDRQAVARNSQRELGHSRSLRAI